MHLLIEAAKRGDRVILEQAVQDGMQLKLIVGDNNETVLHAAAQGGHANLIDWLVKKQGFSPYAEISSGVYAGTNMLHWAALGGHSALIKRLIYTYGFSLHLKDYEKIKAKAIEARSLRHQIALKEAHIRHLENQKFSLNQNLQQPMMLSNRGGNLVSFSSPIEPLTGNKFSLNQYGNDGYPKLKTLDEVMEGYKIPEPITPDGLMESYKKQLGKKQLSDNKLEKNEFPPPRNYGEEWYLKYRELEDAKYKLDQCKKRLALIHRFCLWNNNANRVLNFAAIGGQIKLIKWLIDDGGFFKRGLLLHEKGDYGENVLHYAAFGGQESLIEWLVVTKGFSLQDKDDYGRDVLHYAALGGQKALIKWLINSKGFALQSEDCCGESVLHHVAAGNHPMLIAWLVNAYGLSLQKKNIAEETPLELVQENKLKNLILELVDSGVDVFPIITPTLFYNSSVTKVYTDEERSELETRLKAFQDNEKLLNDMKNEIVNLNQSESGQKFQDAYSKLNTGNDLTHGHRLMFLSHIIALQSMMKKINALNGDTLKIDRHQNQYKKLISQAQVMQEYCLTLLQHKFIRENWVRIRIWHSGNHVGDESSSSFTSDGNSGLFYCNLLKQYMGSNPANSCIGHVSLETSEGYMSFWPEEIKLDWNKQDSRKGMTTTLQHDMWQEGKDHKKPLSPTTDRRKPDFDTVLHTLDVEAINKRCREMCDDIKSGKLRYAFYPIKPKEANAATVANCVTIIYQLLLAGGLSKSLSLSAEEASLESIFNTPYWVQGWVKKALLEEDQIYHPVVSFRTQAPEHSDIHYDASPFKGFKKPHPPGSYVAKTDGPIQADGKPLFKAGEELIKFTARTGERIEFMRCSDGQRIKLLPKEIIEFLQEPKVDNPSITSRVAERPIFG